MDDTSDSEDSLAIAQKSWVRLIDAASKTGYREGIEEGSQAILQTDFDRGYEDGFRAAFELGKYKGLAATCFKERALPDEIAAILEKTRRGACHICNAETRIEREIDLSSMRIIDEHREHVAQKLKKLREYFEPLMKETSTSVAP